MLSDYRNWVTNYSETINITPAAEMQYSDIRFAVLHMYRYGYYVEKSEQEAFQIYHRCLSMMDNNSSSYIAGPVHLRLGDMYLNGLGTEQDCESALFHYGLAEVMLYRMVKDGDYMYKKSLRMAIEGQAMARAQLTKNIPEAEWIDEQV